MRFANSVNLVQCGRCDALYDKTIKWSRGYYIGTSDAFVSTSKVKSNECPICGKERE